MHDLGRHGALQLQARLPERDFFIDNLLVRIHFIIVFPGMSIPSLLHLFVIPNLYCQVDPACTQHGRGKFDALHDLGRQGALQLQARLPHSVCRASQECLE